MGEQRGWAACSGGWGNLMTHGAGSATTQSIALKYVIASEPFNNLKQVIAGLPYIRIYYFFKTLIAMFLNFP
jgi:hypothetical protein